MIFRIIVLFLGLAIFSNPQISQAHDSSQTMINTFNKVYDLPHLKTTLENQIYQLAAEFQIKISANGISEMDSNYRAMSSSEQTDILIDFQREQENFIKLGGQYLNAGNKDEGIRLSLMGVSIGLFVVYLSTLTYQNIDTHNSDLELRDFFLQVYYKSAVNLNPN